MEKYLLSKLHKAAIIVIALLYLVHVYHFSENQLLSRDNIFLKYSEMVFVIFLVVLLITIKKENWKPKIKILTLVATLVIIFFNTAIQLDKMSDLLNRMIEGKAITVDSFMALINTFFFYEIAKIVLFDVFAIFAYLAINKTVDEIDA